MLAPVRTVAPVNDVLSLAETVAHLRVDHSDENDLISSLVESATAHLDGYAGILGRALITQTWTVDLPTFRNRLDLPLGPMQSATIQYYDSTNTQQTLATSVYAALSDGLGPYISLKYNQQWPQTYTRDDAVKVTWVAGYGDDASDVPAAIRAAMLLMIGHWYANRETVGASSLAELPMASKALLTPFRRVGT